MKPDRDIDPPDLYNSRFDLEEVVRRATEEYRQKMGLRPLGEVCPICGSKNWCQHNSKTEQRDDEYSKLGKEGMNWNRT